MSTFNHIRINQMEPDEDTTKPISQCIGSVTVIPDHAKIATPLPIPHDNSKHGPPHSPEDDGKESPYHIEENAWNKFNPPLELRRPKIIEIIDAESQWMCKRNSMFSKKGEKKKNLQPPRHDYVKDENGIKRENLVKLLPSEPLPLPPTDNWSFDEVSRTLRVDFTSDIAESDKRFFLEMMERTDISLVCSGLAGGLNRDLWNTDFIAGIVGDELTHKIRRFWRVVSDSGYVSNVEMDGNVSMKLKDYVSYLDLRKTCLENIQGRRKEANLDPVNPKDDEEDKLYRREQDEIFEYFNHAMEKRVLNCVDMSLYLIDYDLAKLLPDLDADFKSAFRFPGLLPGGKHCMMNSVNPGGRPFMGPNLYLTPPSSFTNFHQDGHGTVDSGHQCLSGYNEVVILRRLPERHKANALHILSENKTTEEEEFSEELKMLQSSGKLKYDGMHGLPHADGYEDVPKWPSLEAIQKCKDMNYYPSVLVLKPGEFLHINKGRLHAFRKLSPHTLPQSDCHASQRVEHIKSHNLGHKEHLCLSIAWDWIFNGFTAEGINREIASVVECCQLNRDNLSQSLAIPETCLLIMARNFTARCHQSHPLNSLLPFRENPVNPIERPTPKTILRGILPSLQHIVSSHCSAVLQAYEQKTILDGDQSTLKRISLASRPNTWENPLTFSLDPYGNGDFVCKLCFTELSNVYMHCDGCELILNKDFNICVECHASERYKTRVQMHPLNDKKHSTINHTGDFERMHGAKCPCKNGPKCKNCDFCSGCSCKCHRWFTLHQRFMTIEEEIGLLRKVKEVVAEDSIKYGKETTSRLSTKMNKILDLEELVEEVRKIKIIDKQGKMNRPPQVRKEVVRKKKIHPQRKSYRRNTENVEFVEDVISEKVGCNVEIVEKVHDDEVGNGSKKIVEHVICGSVQVEDGLSPSKSKKKTEVCCTKNIIQSSRAQPEAIDSVEAVSVEKVSSEKYDNDQNEKVGISLKKIGENIVCGSEKVDDKEFSENVLIQSSIPDDIFIVQDHSTEKGDNNLEKVNTSYKVQNEKAGNGLKDIEESIVSGSEKAEEENSRPQRRSKRKTEEICYTDGMSDDMEDFSTEKDDSILEKLDKVENEKVGNDAIRNMTIVVGGSEKVEEDMSSSQRRSKRRTEEICYTENVLIQKTQFGEAV